MSDSAFAVQTPPRYSPPMSLEQIEQEVAKLERDKSARFSVWFESFRADAWDKQITHDAEDGAFDSVFAKIDEELKRGELCPLLCQREGLALPRHWDTQPLQECSRWGSFAGSLC